MEEPTEAEAEVNVTVTDPYVILFQANLGGRAGNGAVRIIWGSGRAFPSTDTGT